VNLNQNAASLFLTRRPNPCPACLLRDRLLQQIEKFNQAARATVRPTSVRECGGSAAHFVEPDRWPSSPRRASHIPRCYQPIFGSQPPAHLAGRPDARLDGRINTGDGARRLNRRYWLMAPGTRRFRRGQERLMAPTGRYLAPELNPGADPDAAAAVASSGVLAGRA
jgi:hypothetical protein